MRKRPINYEPAVWLWRCLNLDMVVLKNDAWEHEFRDRNIPGGYRKVSRDAHVREPKTHNKALPHVKGARGTTNLWYSPAAAWSKYGEAYYEESRALWLRMDVGCDEQRAGNPLREGLRLEQLEPVLDKLKRHHLRIGALIDTGFAFELLFFLRRRVKERKDLTNALSALVKHFESMGADPEAAKPVSWLSVPGTQRLMPRRTSSIRQRPPNGECRLLYLDTLQEHANAMKDVEYLLGCQMVNRRHPGRNLPPPM